MGLKKLKEKRSRYDDAQEEREEVKVPKKLVEEAESLDISMTDNFPLRRIKATVGEKEDNVEEADTKLKQKKKLKTHHNAPATSDPEKHKQAAIDYLKMWKKKNGEWKFQKLKQVWLLRNTYKTDMVRRKYIANNRGF